MYAIRSYYDIELNELEHYALGKRIAELNLDNILFIGSGNLVHNLYEVNFDDNARPFEWAKDINEWLVQKIKNKNIKELVEAKKYMPNYKKAAPSDDHYLPLLRNNFV